MPRTDELAMPAGVDGRTDADGELGIGFYVHVPFCTTKCGYCDFYSLPLGDRNPTPLVDCLVSELQSRARPHASRIRTVFVGGGTPTLLPPADLGKLLGAINESTDRRLRDEFTVEANPATLDEAKAAMLHDAGVDRISFGAQSFHPNELAVLERIHDPADVPRSVAVARQIGDFQINLDLIFGVPSQTLASFDASITQALALAPDHVSLYSLMYEPGTTLTARRDRGLLVPCDESLERDMFFHAIDRLTAEGFEHYEISNFARPGRRCRHNLGYWRNQPYLGIGPSAVSFLDGRRSRNISDAAAYVRRMRDTGDATMESERLAPAAFAGETAMLMLRLTDGLDRETFRKTTGLDPIAAFAGPIYRHSAAGLLAVDSDGIRLTREGLAVADTIMADFLDPVTDDRAACVSDANRVSDIV